MGNFAASLVCLLDGSCRHNHRWSAQKNQVGCRWVSRQRATLDLFERGLGLSGATWRSQENLITFSIFKIRSCATMALHNKPYTGKWYSLSLKRPSSRPKCQRSCCHLGAHTVSGGFSLSLETDMPFFGMSNQVHQVLPEPPGWRRQSLEWMCSSCSWRSRPAGRNLTPQPPARDRSSRRLWHLGWYEHRCPEPTLRSMLILKILRPVTPPTQRPGPAITPGHADHRFTSWLVQPWFLSPNFKKALTSLTNCIIGGDTTVDPIIYCIILYPSVINPNIP